jgi:tRNA U34 5-carboxymethylaminomethyl modifying enzyme MnmG/GidA
MKECEKVTLPSDIDYFQVDNLSKEAQEKLTNNKTRHTRDGYAGNGRS